MGGYTTTALQVDLSAGKAAAVELDLQTLRTYLGADGLAVRLLYEHLPQGVDPLAPENVIVIASSPFAGTIVPAAAKYAVATKSPLTGLLGDSMSGSFFAHSLKRAGYDAMVITGKAEIPTYVFVDDGAVYFRDASRCWGQGCFETEEAIRHELGDDAVRVASIGPAGEQLVRFACIGNDRGRQLGRTGPGAVMGSKNLKAVAVRGSGKVDVADPDGLYEVCRRLITEAQGPATEKYRQPGTVANVLTFNRLGILPVRNFQRTAFEAADRVSGEFLRRYHHEKTVACAACPIACEQIVKARQGLYAGARASLDYETLFALGPCCGIDDLPAIIRAAELCDFWGVDTISTGVTLAWGMEAFEKGMLSPDDVDGIHLEFGDPNGLLEAIPKIARREGLGSLLAEGSRRAAQEVGKGSEYFAMNVKGLELPGYDPRGLKTYALGVAVGTRGACHNRSFAYEPDIKGKVDRFKAEKGRGRVAVTQEDLAAVLDSLGICKFLRGCLGDVYEDGARLYSFVTGWEITAQELREAGERISNLKKLFNLREGWTRELDTLPPRLLHEPIPDGPGKGISLTAGELDLLVTDYYEARGWTAEGRIPEQMLTRLRLGGSLP